MGGEHEPLRLSRRIPLGSSPRGRGTRHDLGQHDACERIIPAWAGNTRDVTGAGGAVPDHPRVGGEHSSPGRRQLDPLGSSPRGRGTPSDRQDNGNCLRIIPAWAGNTPEFFGIPDVTPDHPRVGGEHLKPGAVTPGRIGSSPRGRGTQTPRLCGDLNSRIIPAWAGNTL